MTVFPSKRMLVQYNLTVQVHHYINDLLYKLRLVKTCEYFCVEIRVEICSTSKLHIGCRLSALSLHTLPPTITNTGSSY